MNMIQLLADITPTKIDLEIYGLCLHTADVQAGDVFVALQGKSTHGINYIQQAIDKGCVAVLVDSKDCECSVPSIRINNLKQHLLTLSATCYPQAQQVNIVGITGTNGKTSVAYFISQLLTKLGVENGLIGTLEITNSNATSNNTTPDIFTLYKVLNNYYLKGIKTAILEVSSHGLDQDRVAGLNFNQAIFTNLTQDHLDYHQTLEEYQKTKLKLFKLDSLNCVIINRDDACHKNFLSVSKHTKQITYGLDDFKKIKPIQQGFLCQLEGFVFELSLLGTFNLSNVLAALSSIEQLGFKRTQIIPLLHQLLSPTGRMHKINTGLIWVDYAHTPDALENAITTLQKHYPEHKVRILFGCGGNRDKDKRAQMGNIASTLANSVVLTNDNPRDEDPQAIIDDIMVGIDTHFAPKITLNRRLAIQSAITTLGDDECLLIAGKGGETTQQFEDKILSLDDIQIAAAISAQS